MKLLKRIWVKCANKMRRINSIRHAYDFPAQQDGWIKYNCAILGNRQEGTYFDPFVRRFEESFVMYVSHRNTGSIVRTKSTDGINWSSPAPVLYGVEGSNWEQIVNRASVIKKDEHWLMWYTGQSKDYSAVGVAESSDGIHFKRCLDNPIIFPEYLYEKKSVMNPCVIWDEEKEEYRMWYSAGEQYEPDVICYATSKDGYKWDKYEGNPVFRPGADEYDREKVGGCDVIRNEAGQYVMFYIGYQNIDNARICIAYSQDGITGWQRIDHNPILSPTKDSWDAHAVYKPTVCRAADGDKMYLWYNGRKGKKEYIGIAWKDLRYQKLFNVVEKTVYENT